MNQSLTILFAVLQAIGTSSCMAFAGIVATRRGFITDGGRKCLAELSMNLLMPCLLFTTMVDCTDIEKYRRMNELIGECWVLLIMPLFVVGSGILLGKLVAVLTGCPSNFTKACVGAVAFANSTGMSITILQVLSPALLQHGLVDVDPLVILPVYLLLYPMLQWTVGSYLFGLLGSTTAEPAGVRPQRRKSERQPSLTTSMTLSQAQTLSRAITSVTLLDMDLASASDFRPTDCPCSGADLSQARGLEAPDLEECSQPPTRSQNSSGGHTSVSGVRSEKSQVNKVSERLSEGRSECSSDQARGDLASGAGVRCLKAVSKVVANALVPPVVGSALGLIVALLEPVQGLFVSLPGDPKAPLLSFLFQAMLSIGRASVPVNMLVLGSNLAKGCDFRAVPLSTNLGILFMKMIGQPCLMACAIAVLSRVMGGTNSIWLVAMIVSCTPTANNIMVMVELSGQNKAGVTTCVFTQYLVAPVVLTLVISVFLLGQNVLMPPP